MPTTQARIIDACDAVVTDITATWSPTIPDKVRRAYAPRIGLSSDHKDSLISGRQVYVFPAAWGSPDGVTRGELMHEYTIAIVVAERYTDGSGNQPQGPVPDDWVDARVLFTETLFNRLIDPTRSLAGALVQLFRTPDVPATVDEVYNLDDLLERKAFWSRFTITYHEIVGVSGS